MNQTDFIANMHIRLAQIAIGPSAVRNQGAGGILEIGKNYCFQNMNLNEFAEILSNKELLASITAAQAEIAAVAIEKWKADELKKIKEGNSKMIKSSKT